MIRMRDIAEKAGVSRTTVSFVLNGKYKSGLKISEPIVRRVLETADDLGYVRNEIANSVVTGKSRVIAIISLFQDFMMPAIRGCMEEAQEYGCIVKLIPLGNDVNEAIKKAIAFRVGGIFAMSLPPEVIAQIDPKYLTSGIPSIGLSNTGRMAFDQVRSSMLGTEYLISCGYRKILYWGCSYQIAQEREEGYLQVMRAHGLKPEVIRDKGKDDPLDIKKFEEVVHDFRPDVIQCFSDFLALRILGECYHRRLWIPDAFSILGFGNISASWNSAPLLSTIEEPYYETGRIMFRQIHELIETGRCGSCKPLVGKVIPRETTFPQNTAKKR